MDRTNKVAARLKTKLHRYQIQVLTWNETAAGRSDVLGIDTKHPAAGDTDIRRLVDVDNIASTRSGNGIVISCITIVESDL